MKHYVYFLKSGKQSTYICGFRKIIYNAMFTYEMECHIRTICNMIGRLQVYTYIVSVVIYIYFPIRCSKVHNML